MNYKLVDLELDEGEFKNPLKYETKTATPSDPVHTPDDGVQTTSNTTRAIAEDDEDSEGDNGEIELINDLAGARAANEIGMLVEKGKPDKVTTFAVEGNYLYQSDVDDVAGSWETSFEKIQYNSARDKAQEILWLTEKGKLDTAVDLQGSGLYLNGDRTTLYATTFMKAKIDENTTQLDNDNWVMTNGLDSGVRLAVVDLEERLDTAALEAITGASYTNLDAEGALQFDMKPDRNPESHSGPVTIRMELPQTFREAAEGKSIVVIHIGKNGGEVVPSEIFRWGDEYSPIRGVQFTLNDFSPVIIALADKMVSVKLENVKNGFGEAYSMNYETGQLTYLPVGEEVSVPAGTEFFLGGSFYRNYQIDGYEITVDGESVKQDNNWFQVKGDMDKVVFTPVFTAASDGEDEESYWISYSRDEEWTAPRVVETALKCWHYDPAIEKEETLNVTDWKLAGVEKFQDHEWISDEDLFTLDANTGVLKSTETLGLGEYRIEVECQYDRKTIERRIWLGIGVSVEFSVHMGHYDDEDKTEATIYYEESGRYPQNTKFGTIRQETLEDMEPAMYGGYEFAGWYNGRNELKEDTAIKEAYTPAVAWFRKNKDGKKEWYDPSLAVTGGSGDNNNNNNNNNNHHYSGGGSGGGSSSSSSSTADTISGSWQRDDRGWRFQLSNGSYAVNQWGRLKGVWYYFGGDTYMVTGWLNLNGIWYYLNPAQGAQEGQMKTGWIFDQSYGRWFYLSPAAGTQEGRMLTGWQNINNVWYYLNPVADGTGGAMLADQWVGDYYVNADGAWVQSMTR